MKSNEILKARFTELAKIANQAITRNQAIALGKDSYMEIEYNSIYGGYRLISVRVDGGYHDGIFGGNGTEGRLKAKEMEIKINSLIQGIKYAMTLVIA